MNKKLSAFSILRTPENAEEINEVANEWNRRLGKLSTYEDDYGFMSFDGDRFQFTFNAHNPTITLDQFREYFKEKKQYTLPDGDVVSEGDEVWWFGKRYFEITSNFVERVADRLNENEILSQAYSTREKCEQALNEYKLKLAAERYPKGTNFKGMVSGKILISSGEFTYNYNDIYDSILGVTIYYASTNQWAEIVPSEHKQPIAYRCPFEFKYDGTTYNLGMKFTLDMEGDLESDDTLFFIPLEIAIRAGFEPIYESPLESFAKKHNLSSEAITELEQLIKK